MVGRELSRLTHRRPVGHPPHQQPRHPAGHQQPPDGRHDWELAPACRVHPSVICRDPPRAGIRCRDRNLTSQPAAERVAGYQLPVGEPFTHWVRTIPLILSTAPVALSLSRPENSLTYRCRCLGSTWWNAPLYPRLAKAQNDSIPLIRIFPRTYTVEDKFVLKSAQTRP